MGSYHRNSLPQQHSDRRTTNLQNIDRFIPNRSAMDFDCAHYMLTEEGRRKQKENPSPASVEYRKLLAEALNLNRTRILAFKNNPSTPIRSLVDPGLLSHSSLPKPATTKPPRQTWKSEMTLDAPDILDDFYLNLLDWGISNVIAIALRTTVYLWDASNGSTSELVTIDDEDGPITSVSWAPDGLHIAVG